MELNIADTSGLHYLGNYVRTMPVSLHRMMENAYDWEHLPFIHPSAFASIELIDQGEWGWQCRTTLPAAAGGGEQELQLLVDRARHYWATTVLSGAGEGVQIHTQATANNAHSIEVDVRFYLPQPPQNQAQGSAILAYLQNQYAGLYDEDEALMSARQTALDNREWDGSGNPRQIDLGRAVELDKTVTHSVALANGAFTVRYDDGEWIAHASQCPHMLGPLADAAIVDKHIVCPWHNYAFAVRGGEEREQRCGALPEPPSLTIRDGRLIVGD
ncbi:MAG: Rieske (2Fe-2S) protein [Pontixanthobacter sp.]